MTGTANTAEGDKILIVDDDPGLSSLLERFFTSKGYRARAVPNTEQMDRLLAREVFNLVVLDLMLPGEDGLSACKRLRQSNNQIPIIMLTAKGEEDNKIQGLEVGADDYITKPFSPRELLARLKAVLRRAAPSIDGKPIVVEGLCLDPSSHRVSINDKPVEMGPTEYRLLTFFLTHQERVYSRSQLLDQVWGGNVYVEERTIDVHIRRLRKALSIDDCDNFIQTVRGSGYRFSAKLT